MTNFGELLGLIRTNAQLLGQIGTYLLTLLIRGQCSG